MTRQDYLWCTAAIVTIALEYGLVAFLGIVPNAGKLQLLVLAPGVVAALLAVLAPAGRVLGLAALFLVCVLFLEGPVSAALFGAYPGTARWVAVIALYGGPLAAVLAALRLKPPPSEPSVQSVGAFARALTFYAAAQVLIGVALLVLALSTFPRIS